MTTPRRNPLTRRSAERALDGTATSGSTNLDQILAGATVPAVEAELEREGAALTRFQQGGTATTHRAPTSGPRARMTTARMASAGVAVALLTAAGMALAAGLGPGDGFFATPDDDAGPQTGLRTPGPESAEPAPEQDGASVQSFSGLCRAFQAEAVTNGDVATNPAYEVLADDAGGPDGIKRYCQVLLGTPIAGPAGGSTTSTPTGLPTALATGFATGVPPQEAGSTDPTGPTLAPEPTGSTVASPTAQPTQPPVASPTPTPDRPGGKPTKNPRR